MPFAGSLTQVAALPPGPQRDLVDPFAERKRPWKLYLFIVVVLGLALGWYLGKLDSLLPAKLKSTTVMGINAPAYKPAPSSPTTNAPPAN